MKKASAKTEEDSSEEGEVRDDSDDNGWSVFLYKLINMLRLLHIGQHSLNMVKWFPYLPQVLGQTALR